MAVKVKEEKKKKTEKMFLPWNLCCSHVQRPVLGFVTKMEKEKKQGVNVYLKKKKKILNKHFTRQHGDQTYHGILDNI